MHSLSSTHRAFDRSFEFLSHLAEAAAAVARRPADRARAESVLRELGDEQLEDAGIDRPVCRPQSAFDALLMSELMSMR